MTNDLTRTNFADKADEIMKSLSAEKGITTSKIRNILSSVSEIGEKSKKSQSTDLSEDELVSLQLLRTRIAYDAGREGSVRRFIDKAKIIDYLKDIGKSREKLNTFYNYFEALVAFHRYYGGKDK